MIFYKWVERNSAKQFYIPITSDNFYYWVWTTIYNNERYDFNIDNFNSEKLIPPPKNFNEMKKQMIKDLFNHSSLF